MSTMIPTRLLFRFEFPLSHARKTPRIDGRLRDWSDAQRLPDLGELDGEAAFADIWACWADSGLGIAARVRGKRSPLKCTPAKFWTGDNLRLMLDMRDTRHIKRATRFCQHFYFLPTGGPDGTAVAGSHAVRRAKEDAPAVPDGAIDVAASVLDDGYDLEAFIPAKHLCGFDPAQHARIGFFTMLEDRDLGRQSLAIGDDLPWHMDPSLWATAVLKR